MLKTKKYQGQRGEIGYAEGPQNGSPLVLIHGFSQNWQGFLPILPVLTMRWHVYALDLRGHGSSSKAGPYRVLEWTEDVAEFLQAVIGRPAHLLGHSLGGTLSIILAEEQPKLVSSVIVGDTSLNPEHFRQHRTDLKQIFVAFQRILQANHPMERMIEALSDVEITLPGTGQKIRIYDETDSLRLRYVAQGLRSVDPEIFTEFINWFEGEDSSGDGSRWPDRLAEISCPFLAIQADPQLGAVITDADIERGSSLIPDFTHVQIAGVTHGLGLDTWEVSALLRSVVFFLSSL